MQHKTTNFNARKKEWKNNAMVTPDPQRSDFADFSGTRTKQALKVATLRQVMEPALEGWRFVWFVWRSRNLSEGQKMAWLSLLKTISSKSGGISAQQFSTQINCSFFGLNRRCLSSMSCKLSVCVTSGNRHHIQHHAPCHYLKKYQNIVDTEQSLAFSSASLDTYLTR